MKIKFNRSSAWCTAYAKYVKDNTITQRLFISVLFFASLSSSMIYLKLGPWVIISLSFLTMNALMLMADFCLSLHNIIPIVKVDSREALLTSLTLRTERLDPKMMELEARSREIGGQIDLLQMENQELSKKAYDRHLEIRAQVELEVEPLLDSPKIMAF